MVELINSSVEGDLSSENATQCCPLENSTVMEAAIDFHFNPKTHQGVELPLRRRCAPMRSDIAILDRRDRDAAPAITPKTGFEN